MMPNELDLRCPSALRPGGDRRLHALLLFVLALCVGSCGGSDSGPSDSAGKPRFKVALLLAGPENDEGWNQSAYEGLLGIGTELDAEVRKVRASTASEIERAMRRAAAEHFDLVIGHGFEFNEPAAWVATDHPEMAFVTTGGPQHSKNLATVRFRVEEAAYALGVLAGHLSKSGVLSALSGERFEPVVRVVHGLRKGFLSVRPDGQVLEEYLGSWEDSLLAKEKAFAHERAGADLFFQNADAAGVGIFEACRTRGHWAFGCNRDQSSKAPDVIVASAVANIPAVLLALAQEVHAGEFQGGERSYGMLEHAVSVIWNDALSSSVSQDARDAVQKSIEQVARGTVRPGDP